MRPDRSSLRNALATAVSLLVAAVSWTASAVRGVLARSVSMLGSALEGLRSASGSLARDARGLLAGPVRRAVSGPVRVAVLGRRSDVSLLVVLLGPVLAAGAAWWVGSTVGYGTLHEWVRGTWDGTDPSTAVFLAAGILIALGAVSAAINSGLLPTTALVSAPVFGAAVTRYGTEVARSWGTTVVSLPEAVGVAAAIAVGAGVPIAACGFLLGVALRRVVAVFAGESGPSERAEGA